MRSAFIVLSLALVLPFGVASCRDDDDDGPGAEFFVIGASLDDDRVLPQEFVYLNDPVRILMSDDVDPATVDATTVEFVNADEGGAAPDVSVIVDGPWIAFVPRFPASPSRHPDAGFAPGAAYRIAMPSFDATGTVRSDSGRGQLEYFETAFRVRDSGVLLRDLGPGAPSVEAVAIDLDGDGAARADGLASTREPEEFFSFSSVPFVDGVPPGLLRQPTRIEVFLSEPVFESTLLARVRLETAASESVAATVAYETSYEPSSGRFRARVALTPAAPLEPETLHRIVIDDGVVDFDSPGNSLFPFDAFFLTGAMDASLADAVIEEFADAARRDPSSSAYWNVGGSGRLEAGLGLGGNGSLGDFLPQRGETILDTSANGGAFDFASFRVPAGRTVRLTGPNPALIRVRGEAVIFGSLESSGSGGRSSDGSGVVLPGGEGGAGGGRGGDGNPNGASSESPCGGSGFAPPGVGSAGACPTCGSPRGGGGCGGARAATLPSGGGGGGHAAAGEGEGGGIPYGDESIADLLGGSGGGAGGNTADGDFLSDTLGGSGGGGGGAIAFEVGERFVLSGRILADGGRGGRGAFVGGGGGGGGSGGAVRIRARSAEFLPSGELSCGGGDGGRSPLDDGLPGGAGAPGRVRLETREPPLGLEGATVTPAASVGDLVLEGTSTTFAASLYYDTFAASPRYAFDGSDPRTGALRARAGDVALAGGAIPPGASARIEFFGADEDGAAPGAPDVATEAGPVTNVALLDGKRFIRFRIEFVADVSDPDAPPLAIERLSVRFRR